MTTSAIKSNLGIIVAVGSVWGLTEFAVQLVDIRSKKKESHGE